MHYPELMERAEVLDPNDDFYHFRTNAAHLVYKACVAVWPKRRCQRGL
jgi:hypothetical protein